MVRMRSTTKVRRAADDCRSIVLAGSVGSGVGPAADILCDVAGLSHHRPRRSRGLTSIDGSSIVIESVTTHRIAADRSGSVAIAADIAVVWDDAAAAALDAAGISAAEAIHRSQSHVPAWRRNMPTDGKPADRRAVALLATAELLAAVSRRLPYSAELWRRTIALHVPPRYRDVVVARFDAAVAD
jgi:hypothetical protein